MSNLAQITPCMHVRELEPAVAFFRDRLGFSVQFQRGDYALVQREAIGIRIHAHDDEYMVPGNRSFRYYIDVQDLDALLAELQAKLFDLPRDHVHGPLHQPYGQREFLILAPDGDFIVFGQAIGPSSLPEDPRETGLPRYPLER